MRIAVPDLVTNSYFPALAAEELGYYAAEGLEAHVELLPPAPRAMAALRDGRVDAVAAGAHTTLTAFPQWHGAKLVVALAQRTPWLLVLRADLPAQRGDLSSVKGLHLGAGPGPDAVLRRLLVDAGIDPSRDGVHIGAVPGLDAPDASFGILAAGALGAGHLDGFWANALGGATAVRRGVGQILADVRRGDGPPVAGGAGRLSPRLQLYLRARVARGWRPGAQRGARHHGLHVRLASRLPAGRFHGPMVVSMRPIPAAQIERAAELSARYPHAHGAPIHVGDPEAIGITDLGRPDYGEPVPIHANEVPVFWGCGVTPQAVAVKARVALMITHEPGQMFVTDLPREGGCRP